MVNRWGKSGNSSTFYFLGLKITVDNDCSHEIKRHLLLGRKAMTNLDSILKSRDVTLPTKIHLVKAIVFQESCMDARVGLWRKLSAKELMLLNCGVGEDSWESLGLQGDPVNPKGNQSLEGLIKKIFFGRTDAEAEAPIIWSPDAKNWLIGKDPYAGKDWRL